MASRTALVPTDRRHDEAEGLELYPTLVAAQDALGRLAEALERAGTTTRA